MLREYAYDYARDWSATNPSIGYSPELGYGIMVRSSNYRLDPVVYEIDVLNSANNGLVANRLWFSELDSQNLTLKNFREVKFHPDDPLLKRGVEDPRLYWKDGSWYFDCIMLEKEHTRMARVATYTYDPETNLARFVAKHEGNNPSKIEKNWMRPYEDNPNFDYIYDCGKIKKGDLIIDIQGISHFELRGGSPLWDLNDGTYLAIVHRTISRRIQHYMAKRFGVVWTSVKNYTHLFARYDYDGRLIAYTEQFQFLDRGVEFAAGLIEHGDDFVVSFGSKDRTSYLARISKDKVFSMLKEI